MTQQLCRLVSVFAWLVGWGLQAQQITWESDPGAVNLTSYDTPMSGSFVFELGVFADTFAPSQENTAGWAANWVPARRVTYNVLGGFFTDDFVASNHTGQFITNKAVYVWGFQGGVTSSEWILFRNNDTEHGNAWTWPAAPSGPPPFPLLWNAATATPVIGTINTIDEHGNPILMHSEAVPNAASPTTTWQQWQAVELVNAPLLNGPNDDPDNDGTNNLLEFVFGTPPLQAGAPPAISIAVVNGYQQITIPRRIDHPATLRVLVSSDLAHWDAGDGVTVVVSNTPSALVVRDLTPLSAGQPQRFMRLSANLPTP
jgi:hypothetical protein